MALCSSGPDKSLKRLHTIKSANSFRQFLPSRSFFSTVIIGWVISVAVLPFFNLDYFAIDSQFSSHISKRVDAFVEQLKYDEARMLLERAIAKQPHNPDLQRCYDTLSFRVLEQWLRQNGAEFSKVQLDTDSPDGRGAVATQSIAAGETFVRIPRHLIITDAIARASTAGQAVVSSGSLYSIHTPLAAFLATERHNPASKWKPFLRSLPQTFAFMPTAASEATSTFLNGSCVRKRISDQEKEIMNEFEIISKVLPLLTFEDFYWAFKVSLTRAVSSQIEKVEMPVIVPYIGSLKHTGRRRTTWGFLHALNAFTIRAVEPFHRGEDIVHRFATRSAGELFVTFGIVPDEPSDLDEALLSFEGAKETEKHRYIGSWQRDFMLTSQYNVVLKRCLSFLRLRDASPDEWSQIVASKTGFVSSTDALSVVNEKRVWYTIENVVASKLNRSRTIVSDTDQHALEDDERLAFEFMKVEMYVAEQLMQMAQAAVSALNGDTTRCQAREACRRYWSDVRDFKLLRPASPSVERREEDGEESPDAINRLRSWVESNTTSSVGDISATEIRKYDSNHRGLHAAKDLRAGQSLIRMPLSKIITSRMAMSSTEGVELQRVAAENDVELSPYIFMSTFVAVEATKAEASDWFAFMQTLPSTIPLPIYYSRDELDELQTSYIRKSIDYARDEHDAAYENLQKLSPQLAERIGRDLFLWALDIIATRAFSVEAGDEKMWVLVPWADMLNHAGPKTQTLWDFDASACEFIVRSIKGVSAGEPIYTTYGKKSNAQLFLHYGFAMENNAENRAFIDFGKKSFFVDKDLDSLLHNRKFFHYLRSKQRELAPHQSSRDITVGALRHLMNSANDRLEAFATTLKEDQELLTRADVDSDHRHRTAILVRLGEKEILEFWRHTASVILLLFEEGQVNSLTNAIRQLQG